ncbi:MAG TPA: ATP-binding protein [Actinoplanes sp.]|nr:ATP-binding protein [Actinoplanes sp.]
MRSVKRRFGAAFAGLMLLFLAVVLVQLSVYDRLYTGNDRRAGRLAQARDANHAVLQHMTDAETGVRGFQLTGDEAFLSPYDSGRAGAFRTFDKVAELSGDSDMQRLLAAERAAAAHWLYAYAIPIVNAGVADRDEARAARGKEMFDHIRAANAEVDAAIRARQENQADAARRQSRYVQLLFSGLAAAFLVAALLLAAVHQRHLLVPLEHIRLTLRRLAAGDRSARAVEGGPAEMRAVIGSLNGLAERTEQLLEAEQARAVRNELRQAVAAALHDNRDADATARRVAELIGRALGADAVHSRVAVDAGLGVNVCWPAAAPPLPATAVTEILDGRPGTVLTVPDEPGAIAVPLAGDHECPPGLICLVRPDQPYWTAEERRLLAALGGEIDHAVRQQRLHLRQARLISQLRVLDERKDAFVATVTHELRTPLTSILGYTEMLSDGDGGELSPLQRRGVAAILRNAERLQDTVANLLLLDRAASRAAGSAAPVELAVVAAGVAAETTPQAHAKGLEISMNVAPAWVSGDARHLERALRNLVDNAIKFTGAGGRIGCRIGPEGDRVQVVVSDTGIGIPPDDLPGLFTPFHRAANAMDQAVQGPGLGLAIVHAIVTEHGGTVAVRSEPGAGSTFTVSLPALATAPAEPEALAGEPA